jgi:hypothetical protein
MDIPKNTKLLSMLMELVGTTDLRIPKEGGLL